jgi:hypothetical protein
MWSHTLLSLVALAAPAAARVDDPVLRLLDGVAEIAAPGSPGSVCAFGPEAFVVVAGKGDVPVVAGAQAGKGRVLVFGHNGYLGRESLESADTGRLVRNGLRWLAGKRRSPRVACPGKPDLARVLDDLGMKAVDQVELDKVDCVVLDPGAALSRDRLAELRAFLEEGGGVLAATTGWGWQQLNADLMLARDLPGNRLLTPYGLAFGTETVGTTGPVGFLTPGAPPPLCHAGAAFEVLRAGELTDELRGLALGRIGAAVLCLPDHEPSFVLPLRQWLAEHGNDPDLSDLSKKSRDRDWRPLGQRWGQWRVAGPFASPKSDVTAALPPEKALERMLPDAAGPDLDAMWRARGARFGWRVLDVKKDGRDLDVGEVNFAKALVAPESKGDWTARSAAYLYRRVEVDEDCEYALQIGSADGARVWLDGELVVDRESAQPIDEERIDLVLRLAPGEHHILVKVVNVVGRWVFRMQPLSDPMAQGAISAAIDRGVAFLLDIQQVDGSWSGETGYGPGMTAYVVYALAKSALPLDHPAIRRGLAFVEANEANHTYSVSTVIQALVACYRDGQPASIERAVRKMIDFQESNGMWGYPIYPDGTPRAPDLSTTLYAALALRAAHQRGYRVDGDVWNGMVEGALRCWNGEVGRSGKADPAGFSYHINGHSTGSMTTAGVSVLAIAREALEGRVDRRLARDCDAALASGIEWIEQHLSWAENTGNTRFHMFWIYGVERCGNLLGRDVLGGAHWYRGGAKFLVERQNEDGSWEGATGDTHKTRDTILALLFLNRATKPTSGEGVERRLDVLVAEGPDLDVSVRATGQGPYDVWVTGYGTRVLEELVWPGSEQRAPRVERLSWVATSAHGGEEQVLAEIEPREGAVVQRFEARLELAPGTWDVRARVRAERPPATDGALTTVEELVSGSLRIVVRGQPDDEVLAYPRDRHANLLRSGVVTFEASSLHGEQKPERASDGLHATRWHSSVDDAEPWWRARLERGVNADRLLLSHAWPRLGDRKKAQPSQVELVLNGGEFRQAIELDPDPLRKTSVELPPGKVLEVELRILTSVNRKLGTDAVGFSEIELVPGS